MGVGGAGLLRTGCLKMLLENRRGACAEAAIHLPGPTARDFTSLYYFHIPISLERDLGYVLISP